MPAYLLRRVLAILPTLVGISLLAFIILNLIPADPIVTWSAAAVLVPVKITLPLDVVL